jgi:hypothetical protein
LPLELQDDFVELKMMISEQFKSFNFKQNKIRKLCTDEVRRVKMKKRMHFAIRKNCIFFIALFWAAPLALHFKDDL